MRRLSRRLLLSTLGLPGIFGFAVGGPQWAMAAESPPSTASPAPASQAQPAAPAPPPARSEARQKTRREVEAELAAAEAEFGRHPQDSGLRLRLGRLLFQTGDFWRAHEVLAPLVSGGEAGDEALALAAELAYLLGRHAEAEALYQRLVEARAGDLRGQVMAKLGLLSVYEQTNRFDQVKALAFPPGVVLPKLALMQAFTERPYEQEWRGEGRVAALPLLVTDPLPVVSAEFNGRPVQVLIDTGGDTFILDTEIATELGVATIAKAMGTFGGGLRSEVGFGEIDRVRLGEVTLKQVPLTLLPTQRFSPAFEGAKVTVGGILGTAVLRQFLATLDYRQGRLILRERTPDAARKLREGLAGRIVAEVPFALEASHLMMVRGKLNDREGLTFFVDSGLASEAAFAAPIQTLEHAGIPVPETRIDEGSVGGGGGKWASGTFPIARLGIGALTQTDLKGEYGSRPPESYWAHGFIEDGLLSHRFLRRYASWTLDFDAMRYVFEE